MTAVAGKPPWYCFLYRLLGAQGTFWLWVFTIIAVWWTGKGALVRLENLEKHGCTVAEVAAHHDGRRWVNVTGLQLDLDRRLFGAKAPEETIASVMLDSKDFAAAAWTKIKLHADAYAAMPATGEARKQTRALLAELRAVVLRGPKTHLPVPAASILLIGDDEPAAAPTPKPSDDAANTLDQYEVELDRWCELVRACVHPAVSRDGLLDDVPPSVVMRLERDAGIDVAPSGLRLGRRPRDVELYVFAAASLVLIFLAAGFHGVTRWERAQRDAASVAT